MPARITRISGCSANDRPARHARPTADRWGARVSDTFTFHYIPRELSPNARSHWSKVAKVTRKARDDARYLANVQLYGIHYQKVRATVQFHHPKPNVRRDQDNALRCCKPIWDGLVDAKVLVNDDAEHLQVVFAYPLYLKGEEAIVITFEEIE